MSDRKLATRDDFNYWIDYMDEAIDDFKSQLPPEVSDALDWSPASLDALEGWILKNYPNTQAMMQGDNSMIVNGAGRYVGETFRLALGGHWDIDLDNEKNVYFGLPILTAFEDRPTPVSPLSLVTASADRRKGNYLSTILANIMKRKNFGSSS